MTAFIMTFKINEKITLTVSINRRRGGGQELIQN